MVMHLESYRIVKSDNLPHLEVLSGVYWSGVSTELDWRWMKS